MLTDLDAADLSVGIADGTISAQAVMAAVLNRIEAVNPAVNAIVSLRPRDVLMAEAKAADAAPRKGWLHGIPMAIKDTVATAGIRTTWGSPLFADNVPVEDDRLARQIKAAGAIVIGKTNTPEFGMGSHTFNPVHGITRNPYDPGRSAGGSSGGAAAALAARMVPIADGSDIMGSLRNPAAFCNVYGFRPSWGLVPDSRPGDTFLHPLLTEGPMGRSPRDLAGLLQILAVPDAGRPYRVAPEPYLEGIDDMPDLEGARIGWLGDWGGAYPMEPGILDLCETALDQMRALGAKVDPLPAPFPADKLWQSWLVLRFWMNAAFLGPIHADPAKRALLKPPVIWEIENGLTLSAMDVHRASVIRSEWFAQAARTFAEYDALILPSAQVWPFPVDWTYPEEIDGVAMDTYHRWMEVVVPVSLAGLPCLAVPAGFGPQGLPMGMQMFGPRGADRRLLQIGQVWHRATNWPAQAPKM